MAGGRKTQTDDTEQFTDLTPGGGDGDVTLENLDTLDTAPPRRNRGVAMGDSEIKDEELEVVDDEPSDDEIDERDAGDPDGEEIDDPDAGDIDAAAPQEIEIINELEYDPKDARILGMEAQTLEDRKNSATAAVTRAEADMVAAKKAMKTAKENGDTDGDIAANEAYAAALVAKGNAEGVLQGVSQAEGQLRQKATQLFAKAKRDAQGRVLMDEPVYKQTRRPREGSVPAAPEKSKHADAFFKLNPWLNDPKNKAKAAMLYKMDEALGNEGIIDKNDPKYFAELGRRFNRQHPGLFKNLDGKLIAAGQRQRQPGSRPPGGGGTPPGRQPGGPAKKIGLTNADLNNMRTFGMDPANMEHRREFLASKRETAAQNQGR